MNSRDRAASPARHAPSSTTRFGSTAMNTSWPAGSGSRAADAARAYLRVIAREPETVRRALNPSTARGIR